MTLFEDEREDDNETLNEPNIDIKRSSELMPTKTGEKIEQIKNLNKQREQSLPNSESNSPSNKASNFMLEQNLREIRPRQGPPRRKFQSTKEMPVGA